MKSLPYYYYYSILITVFLAPMFTFGQTVVDFEDVPLGTNAFVNQAVSNTFVSGDVSFNNLFNPTFGSWSGFAISQETNNVTPGFGNQYGVISGAGNAGSDQFAVGFDNSFGTEADVISFEDPSTVAGFYVNNTTYAALSMRDGDAFAKPFGGATGEDPDYFQLTVSGQDGAGNVVGSTTVLLADYRFGDSAFDSVLSDWQFVDTSGFGNTVESLHFDLESTDVGDFGMNTPAYFALDDISYEATATTGSLVRIVSVCPSDAQVLIENLGDATVALQDWVLSSTSESVLLGDTTSMVFGSLVVPPGQQVRVSLLMNATNDTFGLVDPNGVVEQSINLTTNAVATNQVWELVDIEAASDLASWSLSDKTEIDSFAIQTAMDSLVWCAGEGPQEIRFDTTRFGAPTQLTVFDASGAVVASSDSEVLLIESNLNMAGTLFVEGIIGARASTNRVVIDILACDTNTSPVFAGLQGVVWTDLNNDGSFTNEPLAMLGMTNVVVELYRIEAGQPVFATSTTTGPAGAYGFDTLASGEYLVSVGSLPMGGSLSTPASYRSRLKQGQLVAGQSFGFVPAPTSITLLGAQASFAEGQLSFAWQVADEVDTLGYRVYVSDSAEGPRRALGELALATGELSYAILAASTASAQFIWLEEIDLSLVATLHGPFAVTQPVLATQPTSDIQGDLSDPRVLSGSDWFTVVAQAEEASFVVAEAARVLIIGFSSDPVVTNANGAVLDGDVIRSVDGIGWLGWIEAGTQVDASLAR